MSRIVAGSRGGRRLTMPPGDGTRPTSDRVREAVFSAIGSWAGTAAGPADQALAGLAFCDLYAGSGAVGLEAMSRGAAPVLLVEADRRTAQVTRRNAAELELPVQVVVERVERLLATRALRRFDIVFADPPYALATADLDALVEALVGNGWLAPDGLVILERSTRSAAPRWPAELAGGWSRHYGETTVHYGTRQED